jgi:hypothetical protein
MIHVLAAHGAEPCDDGAGRTLGLGGSSSRIGPGDRLGHFNPGIVAPLGDRSEMAALADGFVDRSAGPSSQSAQHGALRAVRIVHRPAAPTAGSAPVIRCSSPSSPSRRKRTQSSHASLKNSPVCT